MNNPLWHICSGKSDPASVAADFGLPGLYTGWPEQDDRGNSHTPRNQAQQKMWQGGWTLINKGEPWEIPAQTIADFFILTWKNGGDEVIAQARPARFGSATEFKTADPMRPNESQYVSVSKDNPLGGQATDITALANGEYDVEIIVNPIYGAMADGGIARITYVIDGENCNVKKPLTFGTFKAPPVPPTKAPEAPKPA